MFSTDDTIVAIATPPGRASLGVIRLSGPAALAIASRLLTRRSPLVARQATLSRIRDLAHAPAAAARVSVQADPANEAPAGAAAGFARDPDMSPTETRGSAPSHAREIDQVVATSFPRPHSYTGEDVVELAAHGSPLLLQQIVASALDAGARLAAPGEFTLRAFLNGRLDLVQAEAVADLIDAVTPAQARQAFDQLDGTLTRAMAAISESLFDLIVRLEASLDFPDEGYHFILPEQVGATLARVEGDLDALLATARQGRVIREGRQVAIVGGVNVGKSSLFNAFVGSDRAIVTDIAGTTRDLLTERCDIGGIPVTLVDTAGIRDTEEVVEREGVQRARSAAEAADLSLVVVDRSRPLSDDDRAFIAAAGARRLLVINKVDLPAAWDVDAVMAPRDEGVAGSRRARATKASSATEKGGAAREESSRGAAVDDRSREGAATVAPTAIAAIEISVETGAGMDRLREAMAAQLIGDERLRDTPGLSNVRHIDLLTRARAAVANARGAAATGAPEEFVLSDIREAIDAFEEITGRRSSEDVLQAIFGRFCIGK